ncbi:MAG: tryptophan--tRNA ligase [Gemmatimonadota bacterium]|nr:MAG: tryptophan--tRNA ligase [Gemmatimonadota bacterium]
MAKPKPRMFSGIQPSGELHIGNYLGAVKNWVALQHQYDAFFCIVDLHAITQPFEPEEMPQQIFDLALGLLAAGLDPSKCTIFVQSDVPEHSELAWVFTTVTPLGELKRMTQFKDKSSRQESVLAGILNYPILQAADILLYHAEAVPVGEDQVQHIELTRQIANKWNGRFGEYFPEPQAVVGKVRRVLGLDGQAKMSKSIGNTIGVLESPDEIWEKLRPAITDPQRKRRNDPGNPNVCNLFALHRHFSSEEDIAWADEGCRTAGIGCIECKRRLSENIIEELRPIRERALELQQRPEYVIEVLRSGAERASAVAVDTISEVRRRMGLHSATAPAKSEVE